MITWRRVAIGIAVAVVLYVAVFVYLATTVEITGSSGERSTGPVPTEAIGPLSELEFVDGESSNSAVPITP